MRVSNPEQAVDAILSRVGTNVVMATPLGLGKPVELLNALYGRAKRDSSISLTILTGLTLYRPQLKNDLVKRLLEPVFARVFGDYEDLDYEADRRELLLPNNVRIIEFFLSAGSYLNNPRAQQDFILSNYTHVIRDCLNYGINVVAMMVTPNGTASTLSMSCNADLVSDLLRQKSDIMVVGQINTNLPYMKGRDVEIAPELCHVILDQGVYRRLFCVPHQPMSDEDFLIGLYVSSLIKDDGC